MIQYIKYRDGKSHLVHGLMTEMEAKAFRSWEGTKARCNNPNCPAYKNYGERGIKISPEFEHSFDNFFAEVGPPPGPEFSLERIKGDRGYEKGNLKWATRSEQNRNKRTNRWVTLDTGEKILMVELAERAGVPFDTMSRRVEAGWTGAKLMLGKWGVAKENKYEPLEIDGVTRPVIEWAQSIGMSHFGFRRRMKAGLTGAALLAPHKTHKNKA